MFGLKKRIRFSQVDIDNYYYRKESKLRKARTGNYIIIRPHLECANFIMVSIFEKGS